MNPHDLLQAMQHPPHASPRPLQIPPQALQGMAKTLQKPSQHRPIPLHKTAAMIIYPCGLLFGPGFDDDTLILGETRRKREKNINTIDGLCLSDLVCHQFHHVVAVKHDHAST